jgi:predicted methyltransferase
MEPRYRDGQPIKAGDLLETVEGETARVVVVYPTGEAVEGYDVTQGDDDLVVLVEYVNATGKHVVGFSDIDECFENLLSRAPGRQA